MIIGRFTYMPIEHSFEGNHHYRGNILTSCLVFDKVRLVRRPGRSQTDPDYQVIVEVFGADREIGTGWKRTDKRGRECVEISIDDPGLPAPLTAMLLPEGDGVSFIVEWTRQTAKEPEAV